MQDSTACISWMGARGNISTAFFAGAIFYLYCIAPPPARRILSLKELGLNSAILILLTMSRSEVFLLIVFTLYCTVHVLLRIRDFGGPFHPSEPSFLEEKREGRTVWITNMHEEGALRPLPLPSKMILSTGVRITAPTPAAVCFHTLFSLKGRK
jgi:hypothetical protein